MTDLTIATYNVNGMSDSIKRRKIFNYIHNQRYDVVFLQEIHSAKNTNKLWSNQFGTPIYFANGETNSRGVAIIITDKTNTKIHDIVRDPNGRYIFVKTEINDKIITFALHLCTKQR